MNLINKIRIYFGKRALQKEAARLQRVKRAVNLSEAREIGILFNMVSEEEYERVGKFAKSLQEQGKKVHIIGLFHAKKLPPYYIPKLAYDIITPVNLDLFYRPDTLFAKQFIDHPFDILIDLSTISEFPLHYIAVLSKAGFKLGRMVEDKEMPYDLMIESAHEMESEELIENIIHYTSVFRFNG